MYSYDFEGNSWRHRARCLDEDSEIFFRPHGEYRVQRRHRTEKALAICGMCPVMENCRDYALWAGERHGIWGGLSEEAINRILDRQERAENLEEVYLP